MHPQRPLLFSTWCMEQQQKEGALNAFFSWQQAIRDSALEPTTKLVCYTIGTHMAADGTGCYPSYQTIANEAGLHRATAIKHVQKAVDAGFLEVEGRLDDAGEAASNVYRPTMPGVVVQNDHPGRAGRPPVVAQDDPNNPSLTTQLTSTPVVPSGFDEFWKVYPKKEGKAKALSAWKRIRKSDHAAVMAGLELWMVSNGWLECGGKYVPHASTFLNQKRWEEVPHSITGTPAPQHGPITDTRISL